MNKLSNLNVSYLKTPKKQRRPHKMPAGRLFETSGVDVHKVCYSVLLPLVLSFIQAFW